MSIMYSFLLDSESGYNLESTTDSDFYQGTPSYLYYLLKHFYPDTTRYDAKTKSGITHRFNLGSQPID